MATAGFFSFLDHVTYVDDDSSSYEVGVDDNGFSYLDMASEKKAQRLTFEQKQKRDTSAALDGSTRAHGKLNVKKIETADHDELCFDTDLQSILRDMEERRKKVSFFPWAVGLVGALFLLGLYILSMIASPPLRYFVMRLYGLVLFAGGFVLLWNMWKLDISRKHVKFAYRLSGKGRQAFDAINEAIQSLSKTGLLLLYSGRRHFEDTRYSGGASTLPTFEKVRIEKSKPPLLDLDFDVWHLRLLHQDLFFMPDHLMVFRGAETGGVNYSQLRLSSSTDTTQARDRVTVTRDTNIVGKTWRFVNNDGTPDQRFNNNAEVPIVEYGTLQILGSGVDFTLYASNQGSASSAPAGFSSMKELASKPVQQVAEARREKARVKRKKAEPEKPAILLHALCCMMVADGRALQAERSHIQKILSELKSPWTAEEVDVMIERFYDRVRNEQFEDILTETCENVKVFKSAEHRNVFLRCLKCVAESDGKVDAAEARVYEKLKTAVTS
jgi:uncharacterized tellurite resistance protein B-like protein